MIGHFAYAEILRGDEVGVEISSTSDGLRTGEIKISARWAEVLAQRDDYPPLQVFPIETAFCYGLLLAMKLGVPFVVTGDRNAWNPNWGSLSHCSHTDDPAH